MTSTLRLAVFGAGGRIAADYLTVLDGLAGFELTALVETDQAARARLLGEDATGARDATLQGAAVRVGHADHVPLFRDLDSLLLRGPACDAALVLTPPNSHEQLSVALLERGHAVLCEKPLAPSLAAARRMQAAAAAAGKPLAMASKFRFVADVEHARRLLDDGAVGTPLLYENVFCAQVDMQGRWNADPAVSGGGVLIDNGAHAADLAACLGGELRAVTAAAAAPRIQELPVEDTVRVTLETVTGVVGHVDLSWSLNTGRPDYAVVHGTAGSLSLCWDGLRLRHADGRVEEPGTDSAPRGYDKRRAFRAQLEHFAAACRGAVEPRPTPTEALHSVAFIEAAYRAMREHRRVELAEVLG